MVGYLRRKAGGLLFYGAVVASCIFLPGAPCVGEGAGKGTHRPQAAHQVYSDEEIARFVEHDLSGSNLRKLEVRVVSGLVTLRGEALSLGARREAVERARRTHDVREVSDELMVAPLVEDPDLTKAISEKLERYVHYTIYDDVQVAVHNGQVTLTGRVTGSHKVTEIENVLANVDGVREMDNRLKVLPSSSSDEHLRVAVAVSLYRLFPEYATRPAPRIHVVVENGHVTLIGRVRDLTEKLNAETEAREIPGVLSVENRLTTE